MEKRELFKNKEKISLLSIFFNLSLFFVKLITGYLSNSKALIADAIHSLSDLISSLSVYFGIKFSKYKSEEFPFGLYKLENLVSLVSAFAILFAGFEILKKVFFEKSTWVIQKPYFAIFGVLFSILATFLFYKWERKKALELNSPSLLADAEHIKTDMLTSFVVLAGILGNIFGYPWIEKIATLIIVFFIFHASYEIFISAIKVLLDANISKELRENIFKLAEKYPQIKVKEIIGRQSGSFFFLEIILKIDENNMGKAHELAHKFEKEIKEKFPFIERIIIHFEPLDIKEKKRVNVVFLIKDFQEKDGKYIKLASNFCDCKYILSITYNLKEGKVENIKCYKSPCLYEDKPKAFCLIDILEELKADICILSSYSLSKSFADTLNYLSIKAFFLKNDFIKFEEKELTKIIKDALNSHQKEYKNFPKINLEKLEIPCDKIS